MTYEQIALLSILFVALILFVLDIIRYDIVAALTLLMAVFLGLVPYDQAFIGFSHGAVITVAAVFVISRAVENTGILAELADHIRLQRKNIPKQIVAICSIVILLSAFINNVGAVALMIPVTLTIARIKNIPRGALLMPLAFSSLLGGLITLIGTPPNIIISNFRRNHLGEAFYFFDFTPVGLSVTLVGLTFIALFGWRLIPLTRTKQGKTGRHVEKYTLELRVKSSSPLINKKLASIMGEYQDKFELLSLVRNGEVFHENLGYYTVCKRDSLIIETDKWTASEMIKRYKLQVSPGQEKLDSSDHYLSEMTILPQSTLCNKLIADLDIKDDYGIEIIAVSRGDLTLTNRLEEVELQPGDVLLVKTNYQLSQENMYALNCVLLDESRIHPFSKKASVKVLSIFGTALIFVMFGLIRVDVAFFAASILMMITKCLSLKKAYESINLPIIVLIATLIPVGMAMEETGTARLLGQIIFYYGQTLPVSINLYILVLVSMLLSNLINNAAVALIFAPIALQMASDWSVSPDSFLMAVAVGASCAFLTPIGHQSNTLVMGPGNYRFADYWRMGLPLSLLLSVFATIFIMIFWPLR